MTTTRKTRKTRKPRNPGKVLLIRLDFTHMERREVLATVEREHKVSVYRFSANSNALDSISDLSNSGAVHTRLNLSVYPSLKIWRTLDELALDAMGND